LKIKLQKRIGFMHVDITNMKCVFLRNLTFFI
jgi:hypothetical protein